MFLLKKYSALRIKASFKSNDSAINPYSADICLYQPWTRKGCFQIEIIIRS